MKGFFRESFKENFRKAEMHFHDVFTSDARILDSTCLNNIELFFRTRVEYSILWTVQHHTNYSYTIKLFEPNELLGRDRTTWFCQLFEPDWTVRPKLDYSVLAKCSNQVGLFDLCRILWSISLFYLFSYLILTKMNELREKGFGNIYLHFKFY